MDKNKQKRILDNQKFEAVTFALDYIQEMKNFTGEVSREDFLSCLERIYDIAFDQGRMDILQRYIYSMFHEVDEIEDRLNS